MIRPCLTIPTADNFAHRLIVAFLPFSQQWNQKFPRTFRALNLIGSYIPILKRCQRRWQRRKEMRILRFKCKNFRAPSAHSTYIYMHHCLGTRYYYRTSNLKRNFRKELLWVWCANLKLGDERFYIFNWHSSLLCLPTPRSSIGFLALFYFDPQNLKFECALSPAEKVPTPPCNFLISSAFTLKTQLSTPLAVF